MSTPWCLLVKLCSVNYYERKHVWLRLERKITESATRALPRLTWSVATRTSSEASQRVIVQNEYMTTGLGKPKTEIRCGKPEVAHLVTSNSTEWGGHHSALRKIRRPSLQAGHESI